MITRVRPTKKAHVESVPPSTQRAGPAMAVTNEGREDTLRRRWLDSIVRVAEGAGVNYPGVKCNASACVAAVVFDDCDRLTGLGGREGQPRSLGSVYAGAVALFLPHRHFIAVSPGADRPPSWIDGGVWSRTKTRATVGGGVYALATAQAGPSAVVAVLVRSIFTHRELARVDLCALLTSVSQLALYEGALAAGAGAWAGAGAGADCVTLLLAGTQPTAGQGRVVAVQLQKQQDGLWTYAVLGSLDLTRATLTGVTVVRPQGPDGALQAPVIVAATPTGSVVVFPGLRSRGTTVVTKLGAPTGMCSMLEPGTGRPGARFAVIETAKSCVTICRVCVDATGRLSALGEWSSAPGLLCSPSNVTCTGAGELLVRDTDPGEDVLLHPKRRDRRMRVFPPYSGDGVGPCQALSPQMLQILNHGTVHGTVVACRDALLCIASPGAVRSMYALP